MVPLYEGVLLCQRDRKGWCQGDKHLWHGHQGCSSEFGRRGQRHLREDGVVKLFLQVLRVDVTYFFAVQGPDCFTPSPRLSGSYPGANATKLQNDHEVAKKAMKEAQKKLKDAQIAYEKMKKARGMSDDNDDEEVRVSSRSAALPCPTCRDRHF